MRLAPLFALGVAMSAASFAAAQAASQPTPSQTPTPSSQPMQPAMPEPSQSQPAAPSDPSTATQPQTPAPSATPSAPSAAEPSAAAPSAAMPAALQSGEAVKDNTGATIGQITSVTTNASGQQMAVIKMGSDTFQVQADRLGNQGGTATINMTMAQISGMLHPGSSNR